MNHANEEYSAADLMVLAGNTKPVEPNGYMLLLAKVLKDPMRLPFMLEEICALDLTDEEMHSLRMALIRVQIESDLRMHEDIQRYQQRRYVAQVIEILLFEELLLSHREPNEYE